MKVTAVARAQSTHSLPGSFFATAPVLDLVDQLRETYQFRTFPSGQELLNPQANQPVNFLWGKRNIEGRQITIETLQILNVPMLTTSVSVITRTSTKDSDLILNDLMSWVSSAFTLEAKAIFPRSYLSQLEFTLEASIAKRLDFLKPLGELIAKFLRGYGFAASPEYEPTSMSLFFDNTKPTNPPTLAGAFYIDRRTGFAYEENRFFSQAFLRTEDHVRALQEFERALRAA